jgi:hypothetical protein
MKRKSLLELMGWKYTNDCRTLVLAWTKNFGDCILAQTKKIIEAVDLRANVDFLAYVQCLCGI